MKRLLSVLMCISIMFVLICETTTDVNALCVQSIDATNGYILVSETTEQISDELYIVTTIYEKPILTRADRYTRTASKTRTIMNNSGDKLFSITLDASFMITSGISSTCTSVTHSYQIYHSDWNYISGSSYKSGNCAYGSAEFNRRLLGIVVETRTCDISLACDVNGNLS